MELSKPGKGDISMKTSVFYEIPHNCVSGILAKINYIKQQIYCCQVHSHDHLQNGIRQYEDWRADHMLYYN